MSADRAQCMGYAMCAMSHPEMFEVDDEGTVVVRRTATDAERDAVELAVRSCPTGALSIERT